MALLLGLRVNIRVKGTLSVLPPQIAQQALWPLQWDRFSGVGKMLT